MKTSQAYYNHARWVAECPEEDCLDARLVYEEDPRTGRPTGRRLTGDTCDNGHVFKIEMPNEQVEAQIVTAMSEREKDAHKSWFPAGHPRALIGGHPHGQSIADLKRENDEVAHFREQQRNDKKRELRKALAEAGIKVNPDGTFEGVL